MMRIATLGAGPSRFRLGRDRRRTPVIALLVALALLVSPLGMLGMADAHAAAMNGMDMAATGHCSSADEETDRDGSDRTVDCLKACAALAVQVPVFRLQLGSTVEAPLPNVAASPHAQTRDADPPPPRNA